MQKMKAKAHNGSLGLLPRVAPVSLLMVVCFGGRNGVKNGFTPPLYKICQTRELYIFFLQKILCKVVLFIVIFSL